MFCTKYAGPALLILAALSAIGYEARCEDGRTDAAPPSFQPLQIRGGHNGRSDNFDCLPDLARHGMNSVFVSMGGHLVGSDGKPKRQLDEQVVQLAILREWQQRTEKLGILFFPMMDLFGTDDRKRWPLRRWFVRLDGTALPHTPCPQDPHLWREKIQTMFVELARWARDQPNVPGILMDPEMYGADKSMFYGACYCPDCRREVAGELKMDPAALNLEDAAVVQSYDDAQVQIIRRLAAEVRQQVHAIYPGCLLGAYLLDNRNSPIYKAITLGWGTAELPTLVFSEATYEPGYWTVELPDGRAVQGDHPGYILGWQQKWSDWGAHAQFVLGMWINRIPEENVAENLYHMARSTRGFWIYDLTFLTGTVRMPGGGAPAYWDAIGLANQELDRWEASDGQYESDLEVRPFTVPAPGVAMDQWTPMALPRQGQGNTEPGFLFYPDDAIYYIPARQGEQVKLRVIIDSAHPTKKKSDVMAIVLLDPRGEVMLRDRVGYDDFPEAPRADGRWGTSRQVEFQAPADGTYCLMLKAGRYAYGLSSSSHPWLAVMHPPINLFLPRKMYVRSVEGSDTVHLDFSGQVDAQTFDAEGHVLSSSVEPLSADGNRLVIRLNHKAAQTLLVRFEGERIVMQMTGFEGILPWMAATEEAPFPAK